MKEPYQVLLNYSFWLLGRKAYSKAEITKRMSRRAEKLKLLDADAAIQKVIKRLEELNYVNDELILKNYFEYRLPYRPQGRYAFLNEMKRKGIPAEMATAVWNARDIDEEPMALELVEKKKRQLCGKKLTIQEKKRKIASYLAARGFKSEVVWKVLQ
jgi:SOS response regulatory protein OraA/RecX